MRSARTATTRLAPAQDMRQIFARNLRGVAGLATIAALAAVAAAREAAGGSGDGGLALPRAQTATAVRYLLQLLAEKAPGNTVEIRVPPFGAVQVIEGPRHTRGTPPNVVELDPATWIAIATGSESWAAALADGRIHASGTRADLTLLLPLRP